ncbi:MAG: methyltransferase domain-containing protein [Solirubrobacterales bacterium]
MPGKRESTAQEMRIGDLAKVSGVSLRTLRHYDRIGLLSPAGRDESGYRRYGPAEVDRLYRIRALKELGLGLADIASVLDGTVEAGLQEVVGRHLEHVRSRRAALGTLEARLVRLRDSLLVRGEDEDELLGAIAEMARTEKALRLDYAEQGRRYDSTRRVSADVLAAVSEAIDPAPGRRLLDVGGGTGNYAAALRDRGWETLVLDPSATMRRQAESKGLATIAGEATALPFAESSFDAVTMVSMIHQVGDWRGALAEARRVLRPGGRLAVMGLAAEHLREVAWAYDLFPSMREFALPHRPTLAEMLAELPGATVTPIWFMDLSDASIGALCAHPEAMLDPAIRRQTSFFERLAEEHPDELERGLETLRRRLAEGRRPEEERAAARRRLGDASVIAWATPDG